MPPPNVDVVLVVDASASMQNCFTQLRQHLDALLSPLQGYVSKVRFGLVAMSCGKQQGGVVYLFDFVHFFGMDGIHRLYQDHSHQGSDSNGFFTENPKDIASALARLTPGGDEDMLLALDVAADLPFGPVSNTKRVIALFSDEPFEEGVSGADSNRMIPALQEKLMARHIQLFAAVPDGDGIQQLATTDRSEIEIVQGGNGLAGVDFSRLLGQMGKSISGTSLQSVAEPPYRRALFGQDNWVECATRPFEGR